MSPRSDCRLYVYHLYTKVLCICLRGGGGGGGPSLDTRIRPCNSITILLKKKNDNYADKYASLTVENRQQTFVFGRCDALDRFSDACSVAEMKISTTKTETMCLSRQPKQCSLQIDRVSLKQSEKFKYLGVSFTSDGKQNSKLDIRIG